eukprot:SAG11_NODE_12280_length_711_cov_0.926471_1_plen_155_part_00
MCAAQVVHGVEDSVIPVSHSDRLVAAVVAQRQRRAQIARQSGVTDVSVWSDAVKRATATLRDTLVYDRVARGCADMVRALATACGGCVGVGLASLVLHRVLAFCLQALAPSAKGHDCWTQTFRYQRLWRWLLAQQLRTPIVRRADGRSDTTREL